MDRPYSLVLASSAFFAAAAIAQVVVPTAAPTAATVRRYRDARYGVRFRVPPGWTFTGKDRRVSTFRLDARSAVPHSQMRAVASLDFNPFPLSTLSGALFYYSVERHSTDRECERQVTGFSAASDGTRPGLQSRNEVPAARDVQNIGGMDFLHGHDEHGSFCVEARDEVYTAFHKGSCYRFDLAVNTFCSESSGAQDITDEQLLDIEGRMAGILSTVALDWEKSGPHPVPPVKAPEQGKPSAPSGPAGQPAKEPVGGL